MDILILDRSNTEQMKRKKFSAVLGGISLLTVMLVSGCSRLLVLNPKGPVGYSERSIILATIALMLIVVIPVVVMVVVFPGKYRASNTRATYTPEWSRSQIIEWVIWLIPAVIVAALGILVWWGTYRLDPSRPLDTGIKPISIEAVSLDWKWLFIYPDQQIACVNKLVFPAKVPLSFRITSDTVMTSFFIPQLGSQIYAMAGMQTRLHLLADEPGVYTGQNQQFSGRGYADMTFTATAAPREQFEDWVRTCRQSQETLDPERYAALKKPGTGFPATCFSSVTPGLFEQIILQYRGDEEDRIGAANLNRESLNSGDRPRLVKGN